MRNLTLLSQRVSTLQLCLTTSFDRSSALFLCKNVGVSGEPAAMAPPFEGPTMSSKDVSKAKSFKMLNIRSKSGGCFCLCVVHQFSKSTLERALKIAKFPKCPRLYCNGEQMLLVRLIRMNQLETISFAQTLCVLIYVYVQRKCFNFFFQIIKPTYTKPSGEHFLSVHCATVKCVSQVV